MDLNNWRERTIKLACGCFMLLLTGKTLIDFKFCRAVVVNPAFALLKRAPVRERAMAATQPKLDLQALAGETSSQLTEMWNVIGVPSGEREQFLADLTARVAALYRDAVSGEEARQKAMEAEIDALQQRITSLNTSMGQDEDVVRGTFRQPTANGRALARPCRPLLFSLRPSQRAPHYLSPRYYCCHR